VADEFAMPALSIGGHRLVPSKQVDPKATKSVLPKRDVPRLWRRQTDRCAVYVHRDYENVWVSPCWQRSLRLPGVSITRSSSKNRTYGPISASIHWPGLRHRRRRPATGQLQRRQLDGSMKLQRMGGAWPTRPSITTNGCSSRRGLRSIRHVAASVQAIGRVDCRLNGVDKSLIGPCEVIGTEHVGGPA